MNFFWLNICTFQPYSTQLYTIRCHPDEGWFPFESNILATVFSANFFTQEILLHLSLYIFKKGLIYHVALHVLVMFGPRSYLYVQSCPSDPGPHTN